MSDDYFMSLAIEEARIADGLDEVPIGCVIVFHDQVIARAYNRKTLDKMATSHAEVLAINEACRKLGTWYLDDCVLYTTVEPCLMCTGAIVQARIKRIVYGCDNHDFGYLSHLDNKKREVVSHVRREECLAILSCFFQRRRK